MLSGLPRCISPASVLGSLASVALSSEPARAIYRLQQHTSSSPLVSSNAINATFDEVLSQGDLQPAWAMIRRLSPVPGSLWGRGFGEDNLCPCLP